jgi:BirA family transcriptional regulator, biotin operon repressor / biotin---[acetyl-CoA-carboxylase] ligase
VSAGVGPGRALTSPRARPLGSPRLHLRRVGSTNVRARELAGSGAPHGTLVTAAEQSAGRGRQGRVWTAPAGRALLCSVVIRNPPRLLPLAAGAAVAEAVEEAVEEAAGGVQTAAARPALVKWPNDVLLGGRKVAGILVEGRPQEHWAVLGIGLNVALGPDDFPPELRATAVSLGLEPAAIEPTLALVLRSLERWIDAPAASVLEAVRARDALLDREVRWTTGRGRAVGIDDDGRLLVRTDGGSHALDAGEVHLISDASEDR